MRFENKKRSLIIYILYMVYFLLCIYYLYCLKIIVIHKAIKKIVAMYCTYILIITQLGLNKFFYLIINLVNVGEMTCR